jgi:hypothetical protein
MGNLLFRILLVPLRVAWLPFRGLIWVIGALTGDNRRYRETEEQRNTMEERPPLTDEAFVEMLGIPPEEAPVWLAVRRAVASHCCLRETALYPDDARTTLEMLFLPPYNAPWYMLTSNWFEVVITLESKRGVKIYDESLQECWANEERDVQLETFHQIAALLVETIRNATGRRGGAA